MWRNPEKRRRGTGSFREGPGGANECITQYFREIGCVPLLTSDEEKELAKKIKKGDREAREKMILANLRLVVSIASRHMAGITHLKFGDLISAGNAGLIVAVDRFDHKKGYRFSTYATCWILQAILREIVLRENDIRVPTNIAGLMKKYSRTAGMLRVEDKEVSIELIAEKMGVSQELAENIRLFFKKTISLDAPIGGKYAEKDAPTLIESLSAEEDGCFVSPEKAAEQSAVKERCASILAHTSISEKEKKVLMMRFGLNEYEETSLEAIGKILGITKERVRQIEERALIKIRKEEKRAQLCAPTKKHSPR